MNIDLNDITFIIVSYKSKKVIYNCINSLPQFSKIIIVENSSDKELKSDLESKYDNIEIILNNNIGMGASNNIGIKKCNTKFAYVLNPDVIFRENTFSNLIKSVQSIDDFSIISPINENKKFPNYEIKKKYRQSHENIIEVDTVDGFSMLINKSKFDDSEFFDENFFLYLENTDLCLRQRIKNQKIFIIKNSEINHMGSYSTKLDQSESLEYIRNWHWMWSKFYFNKKHNGYLVALIKISGNLLSAIIKYLLYSLSFNTHKKKIYSMRILGVINSIIGKKSFLRPTD